MLMTNIFWNINSRNFVHGAIWTLSSLEMGIFSAINPHINHHNFFAVTLWEFGKVCQRNNDTKTHKQFCCCCIFYAIMSPYVMSLRSQVTPVTMFSGFSRIN